MDCYFLSLVHIFFVGKQIGLMSLTDFDRPRYRGEKEREGNYTLHNKLLVMGIHHHINGCLSRHMKLIRSIADTIKNNKWYTLSIIYYWIMYLYFAFPNCIVEYIKLASQITCSHETLKELLDNPRVSGLRICWSTSSCGPTLVHP